MNDKSSLWKIIVSSNQLHKRRNFTNDEWTYWRSRTSSGSLCAKPTRFKNGRGKVCFCLLRWRIYFKSQKTKVLPKETEREVRLLGGCLKTKDDDWKSKDHDFSRAVGLNEYIKQISHLLRHQNSTEYEPTLLCLKFNCQLRTALEEKGLFCQHNHHQLGLSENQNWKVLRSKQKRLKKQAKGN